MIQQAASAPAVLQFTVYGEAATAGSKKAFPIIRGGQFIRNIVTDDVGAKGKSWRSAVQDAARAAFARDDLLRGALGVTFTFYVPRNKGHFGAKGLKPSAPAYPAKRPDVLKLARAVEDAITGIVWADDAQIVDEHLEKRYGEPARCEITITELEAAC